MISLQELLEEIGFEPEVIFLHDGEKDIKINYASLKEDFGFDLDNFLELVPMDGHIFFVNHAWKNETDLHCDTSLLELLKQVDEKQFGAQNKKPASYLLMVQNALEDLRFGDEDGIMELVSMVEANED